MTKAFDMTTLKTDQPVSLTEAQMRHFVSHGYVVLKTDFSSEFHAAMSKRIQEVMSKEGNPGNNILPRVPEVQEVFRHPVIRGALSSVLGPEYIMHPHRHCHFTEPGRKVQSWHKDSYWGYAKVRNHHPWWAMIFYYDHAVDEPLGPSGLLAGTQFYHNRNADEHEENVHLLGEAGTFALIHYDLWHRGNANVSDRTRSMLKFQFVRMQRPMPSAVAAPWVPMNGDGPPNTHETIWAHQWHWLHGSAQPNSAPVYLNGTVGQWVDQLGQADWRIRLRAADGLGQLGAVAEDAVVALAARLSDEAEPVALNAAYALATMGPSGRAALLAGLCSDDKNTARNAAYGLTAAGHAVAEPLIELLDHAAEHVRGYAAFALGEVGLAHHPSAMIGVAALAQRAGDASEWVRRNTAEALGTLDVADGAANAARINALCRLLTDADDQARFDAALALARIGALADTAVLALQQALHDDNRYVRANAVEALNRIGTPDAHHILIDYLLGARWCSTTTPENLF